MSPREESAREYLLSASRVLQAEELHEKALDPFLLQAEFFVSPPEPAPPQGQPFMLMLVPRARLWNRAPQTQHLMNIISFSPLLLSWASCFLSGPQFLIWKMGIKITGVLQGFERCRKCAKCPSGDWCLWHS